MSLHEYGHFEHDDFIDGLSLDVFPEELDVAKMAKRLAKEALNETVQPPMAEVINLDDYRTPYGNTAA